MLMQETNSISKFAGKNLRDIQFEGKFFFLLRCAVGMIKCINMLNCSVVNDQMCTRLAMQLLTKQCEYLIVNLLFSYRDKYVFYIVIVRKQLIYKL